MGKSKKRVLVILGPTAIGKTGLSIELARRYKGEVVSADSRQIYKGLDIGTGKVTKKEMKGVPHHILDILDPKKKFSVAQWKELAEKRIEEIIARGNLPIICGGTGFYIESLVHNITYPEVPPNKELRKELGKMTTDELLKILQKLDKERLKNIDHKNRVRLIRAIEIAKTLGKVQKIKKQKPKYDFVQIGLYADKETQIKRINERLEARIKQGMIREAENLYKKGLSLKRMRELGLEYRYLADFLEKKINMKELETKLQTEIWRYAKRQMTWFRRDKTIQWFELKDKKNIEKWIKTRLKLELLNI